MPLFVRAGSIVPTGPEIQYTREKLDGPIVLHVFTGADGAFSVYEDDGVSEAFAKGQFARIPVTWNEAARTLSIGAREGSYPGIAAKRAISVRFHTPGKAEAPDFSEESATRVVYEGKALTVKLR
jgi:alpha-D-xyloside xylohydrolase